MSTEIDARDVAYRALASKRNATLISIQEVQAMATAIVRITEAQMAEGVVPSEVQKLVLAALDAFNAFEQARFSAREKGARREFERALKAISDHFQMEIDDGTD